MISERSRPYFERQATLGRRVIFSWHQGTRWPDVPDEIAWWRKQGDYEIIEGVHFPTERDASAFDLDANPEWERFDTWQEAEDWLNQ